MIVDEDEVLGFAHVVPAQPGWRVAELWGESAEEPRLEFEPVVAWGELATERGKLVPLVCDGDVIDWKYSPKTELEEPLFFCILRPGEELDPTAPEWRDAIRAWFARRDAA